MAQRPFMINILFIMTIIMSINFCLLFNALAEDPQQVEEPLPQLLQYTPPAKQLVGCSPAMPETANRGPLIGRPVEGGTPGDTPANEKVQTETEDPIDPAGENPSEIQNNNHAAEEVVSSEATTEETIPIEEPRPETWDRPPLTSAVAAVKVTSEEEKASVEEEPMEEVAPAAPESWDRPPLTSAVAAVKVTSEEEEAPAEEAVAKELPVTEEAPVENATAAPESWGRMPIPGFQSIEMLFSISSIFILIRKYRKEQ